jgi:beta-phosphoglucomutase-like phosphatase (HAD superfamily)
MNINIPAIGMIDDLAAAGLIPLQTGGNGRYTVGRNGVRSIVTPLDRKVEFIAYDEYTLCFVKSAMGYPAIYPLQPAEFQGPASAVLMDLDGTSVHSEQFWIWVIEQTTVRLLDNPKFQLESSDLPHVSGHSVSEHLQHCIRKYAPQKSVEEARRHYFDIVHFEMEQILQGRGRPNAFEPAPGLKEFLLELKGHGVRIGLVTSGLYEKAYPEILSAFRTLGLGDPKEFYDAIISAGFAIRPGQAGTLGELTPKPHPWLYAETARVGLGIDPEKPDQRRRVIGMEDSGAGVVSVRLAGFACLGVTGGNIAASGTQSLLHATCTTLAEALPIILGQR